MYYLYYMNNNLNGLNSCKDKINKAMVIYSNDDEVEVTAQVSLVCNPVKPTSTGSQTFTVDATYDDVQVRVKNNGGATAAQAAAQAAAQNTAVAESVQAPIANKKTGTVKKTDNIAMLYNDKDVAMASFSLTNGNGQMATLGLKGVVAGEGANYFDVVSATDSTPVISESDKAVMTANGFAGVCVNGKYKNW